jgi:O-antigen/teichoic acid export membrane protein
MNSSFIKNFTVLFSGATFAQVIPFLLAPIISRLYLPEEYAEYATYTSIVSLAAIFATCKFELAIVLAKNKVETNNIIFLCLYLTIGLSSILLILALIAVVFFSIKWYYITLPFCVLFFSLNTIFERRLNKYRHYGSMSILKIIKTTSESGYNLLGFISLFRTLNLTLGFLIAYFATSLYLIKKEWSLLCKAFREFSYSKLIYIVKKYKDFPIFSLPHTFLNTFSTSIPILIIPYYFDKPTLGLYMFGLKYIQAPLGLISSTFYNILSQEFADLKNDPEQLKIKFNDKTKELLVFSAILLPTLIFSKEIFEYFFGVNWKMAGLYITILAVWIVLGFIVSSFAIIPVLFGKQKQALYFEVIYSISKILPFVIGASVLKFNFESTLILYTIVTSIVLIAGFFWYRFLICFHFK